MNYIEYFEPHIKDYLEENYDLTNYTGTFEDLLENVYNALKNEPVVQEYVSEEEAEKRLGANWRVIPSLWEEFEFDNGIAMMADASEIEIALRIHLLPMVIAKILYEDYGIEE